MNKKTWYRELAGDLVFDVIGSILFGLGVYTFASEANFAPGGISGVALILNHMVDLLPIGTLTLLLNLPIILLTYRTLGHKFFAKSICTMVISTLIMDVALPQLPTYQGDRLLAAVFSGIFMGAGLALIYMRGSSTGGADFVIHACKRKMPHVSLGQISLVTDAAIILLGVPVFGDIDSALYGMISAFALTIVMDKILYGAGSGKLALIISQKGPEICAAIDEAVERGSTLVDVMGSYSREHRYMVMCACSNNEVYKVRTAAHSIDRDAMVMICEANEVFGEGFHQPEVLPARVKKATSAPAAKRQDRPQK